MAGDLLLIGSIPLDTPEQVFRRVGGPLGPYLAYVPDGEVGDRRYWIDGIAYRVFNGHPEIETLRRPAPDANGVESWRPSTDSIPVEPAAVIACIGQGLPAMRRRSNSRCWTLLPDSYRGCRLASTRSWRARHSPVPYRRRLFSRRTRRIHPPSRATRINLKKSSSCQAWQDKHFVWDFKEKWRPISRSASVLPRLGERVKP